MEAASAIRTQRRYQNYRYIRIRSKALAHGDLALGIGLAQDGDMEENLRARKQQAEYTVYLIENAQHLDPADLPWMARLQPNAHYLLLSDDRGQPAVFRRMQIPFIQLADQPELDRSWLALVQDDPEIQRIMRRLIIDQSGAPAGECQTVWFNQVVVPDLLRRLGLTADESASEANRTQTAFQVAAVILLSLLPDCPADCPCGRAG